MTSLAQVGTAWADPLANSYRLKTMPMLTGYGPDGGYDIYGRLVAQFLPKHLPGVSTIFAQNMPSGVGFVSAKYMNKALPQDGTVLGSLAQKLALDSAPAQGRKGGRHDCRCPLLLYRPRGHQDRYRRRAASLFQTRYEPGKT